MRRKNLIWKKRKRMIKMRDITMMKTEPRLGKFLKKTFYTET